MSYIDRDPHGMYRSTADKKGPGPALVGADTLIGEDVTNTKADLHTAPGFDADAWSSMADESWAKSIHTYYKAKPYWD